MQEAEPCQAAGLTREHCSGREQAEGIHRDIPRNPKDHNRQPKRPDPTGREKHSRQVPTTHSKDHVRQSSIGEEWQRQHGKGIERERITQVPMQKLVERAKRSASRAVEAGQPVQRARWKQDGAYRIEEAKNHYRRRDKPQPGQEFGTRPRWRRRIDELRACTHRLKLLKAPRNISRHQTTITTTPTPAETKHHVLAFLEESMAPATSPPANLELTWAA